MKTVAPFMVSLWLILTVGVDAATTRSLLIGSWKPAAGQKSTVVKMVFLPDGTCYADVKDSKRIERWKGDYQIMSQNNVDMNSYLGGGASSAGQRHPGLVKVRVSGKYMVITGRRSTSKWVRILNSTRRQ